MLRKFALTLCLFALAGGLAACKKEQKETSDAGNTNVTAPVEQQPAPEMAAPVDAVPPAAPEMAPPPVDQVAPTPEGQPAPADMSGQTAPVPAPEAPPAPAATEDQAPQEEAPAH